MKYRKPLFVGIGLTAVVGLLVLAPAIYGSVAGSPNQQPEIPPSLITYHLQHPDVNCVEGTLDPFTIHPCPSYPPGTVLAASQGLSISPNVTAVITANTTTATSSVGPDN